MTKFLKVGSIIVLNKYPNIKYPNIKYLVIRGESSDYSLLNLDGYYLAYNKIPDDYKIVGKI